MHRLCVWSVMKKRQSAPSNMCGSVYGEWTVGHSLVMLVRINKITDMSTGFSNKK